jgi:hypothetical protein
LQCPKFKTRHLLPGSRSPEPPHTPTSTPTTPHDQTSALIVTCTLPDETGAVPGANGWFRGQAVLCRDWLRRTRVVARRDMTFGATNQITSSIAGWEPCRMVRPRDGVRLCYTGTLTLTHPADLVSWDSILPCLPVHLCRTPDIDPGR